MDIEFKLGKLEEYLTEIRLRSNYEETRALHMGYFLEGIKYEANKMVSSARKVQVIDSWHSNFPTFLWLLEDRIGISISEGVGSAFGSAKSLIDNLNLFFQSAYLPSEEIAKRQEKIYESRETLGTIIREAYPLKEMDKFLKSEDPRLVNIADKFEEIHKGRKLILTVRNACQHGQSHSLLEKNKHGGYVISKELAEHFSLGEKNNSISSILIDLQKDSLSITNSLLSHFVNDSTGPLNERNSSDKRRYATRRFENGCIRTGEFLLKTFFPIYLGSLAYWGICKYEELSAEKHKDEEIIKQMMQGESFKVSTNTVSLEHFGPFEKK